VSSSLQVRISPLRWHRYDPGDVAVIHPVTSPLIVESLLTTLGWANYADEPITIQHRHLGTSTFSLPNKLTHPHRPVHTHQPRHDNPKNTPNAHGRHHCRTPPFIFRALETFCARRDGSGEVRGVPLPGRRREHFRYLWMTFTLLRGLYGRMSSTTMLSSLDGQYARFSRSLGQRGFRRITSSTYFRH
jgi:hypothetical protein